MAIITSKYHQDLNTSCGIHIPHSFEYATSTGRINATGLTAVDVYKLALQKSDDTLWILTNHGPVTWKLLGGATWGTITGTLSDQTDLQDALDDKSDTTHGHTHASTTGKTANDHHNQQHAIDGSDHTGTLDHSEINDDENTKHRIINDADTSVTELWSADKINTELGTKTSTGHTHEESDITDLDHDAQKIKGVIVDDSAKADGKVLTYESSTGEIIYGDVVTTDEKVKASAGDPTTGYLDAKVDNATIEISANKLKVKDSVFSSTGHAHTESDITDLDHYDSSDFSTDFGNADLANLGTKNHSDLNDDEVAQHRIINDSGTSATELWSADKINAELNTKTSTGYVLDQFTDMKEPTGFPNRTDSTISFSDSSPDRTFTIAPAVSTFDYYIKGVKYTKSGAVTRQITDDEGLHFIYFDGETLTSTTTWSDILFTDYAIASIVYWDDDNNLHVYFADERHGITMDGAMHKLWHDIIGCAWEEGLALGNMTVNGSGDVNSHAQFSVSDGEIHDEDLEHEIEDGSPQDLSTIAQIPIMYRSGATGVWRMKAADDFPIIYDGTAGYNPTGGNDRVPYNEWTGSTWQLIEVGSDNDFVLVHYFATNDTEHPIIGIQGQDEYTNLGNAREGATTEINNLVTSGLPTAEFTPIATCIFQTNDDGYTNTPHAKIRSTDTGDDYVDWRGSKLSQSAGTSSHPNLSELGFDESGHNGFQRETYQDTSNPDADHDSADTNAIGIKFRAGDFWENTSTDIVYICLDATATAAIWNAIVDVSTGQTLTNKTLTTPTIGDLTNATHDHTDNAGGGVLNHSDLNDDEATKHRLINDLDTSATELWSSDKINTELGTKTSTGHTHTESDITDLDHDAQKIKGVIVDDSAKADGYGLVYESSTGNIIYSASAGGTDNNAIHDNIAGEISIITAKSSPTGSDKLLIEDAADTNKKKSIDIQNLPLRPLTDAYIWVGIGGVETAVPLAHTHNHATDITNVLPDQHHNEDHQARHNSGGADALKLDDLATPDDNTDLNATTSAHGLLKKLDNDATHFLDGQGNWSTPDHAKLLNLDYVGSEHTGFMRDAYLTTSDPTEENDNADTAALGREFNEGNAWVNTSSGRVFVCKDASLGEAIWYEVGAYDMDMLTGYTMKYISDEEVEIAFGYCRDNNDTWNIDSHIPLTIDITDSGKNGLDVDSVTANSWYFVHVIKNPTTLEVAGLFSLSQYKPTLPSGFTVFRNIGAFPTDGTSDLIAGHTVGEGLDKYFIYDIRHEMAYADTTGSWEDVDLSSRVPPDVRLVELGFSTPSGGDDGIYVREKISGQGSTDYQLDIQLSGGPGACTSRCGCDEDQIIQWNSYWGGGAWYLYVLGFYISLAATKFVGIYWETSDFDESQQIDFDTTASGANVSGNVTNFPVCVRITDTDILDAVRDGAPDIRFLDKDGTTWLDYEVEKWDKVGEEAVVWVLVPQIDGNKDDDYITMYYGNIWVQDGQDSKAVFSIANGFLGVWHMNQDPSVEDIHDSSEKGNDGVPTANMEDYDLMAGPINKSIDFYVDGSEYINVTGFDEDMTDATLSAWVYVDTEEDTVKGVLFSRGTDTCGLHLSDDSGDNRVCYHWDGDAGAWGWQGGGIVDAEEWNFVAMTIDADADDTGYVGKNDGDWDSATNSITTGTVTLDDLRIATDEASASRGFDGKIAEVRIESVIRTDDWLKLCYMNQKATDKLISFP